MNRNGIIVVVVIIVLILIAIIGYASYSTPAVAPTDNSYTNTETGSNPGDQSSGGVLTTVTNSTTTTTTTVPTTTGQSKTFTVTGANFSFTPSTITVNQGDKVTINFVNSGGFHDFRIDEFNVATPQINGGQSATVTFTADKKGTFQYYCSVGNHRQMGMVGTLTVQ